MSQYELLDDLYAYNDWANTKVLSLCEGLTDAELNQSRDIGFGSLRAVLFHILTAERVWMERWTGVPWRRFPTDPDGITLAEIQSGLKEVAAQRRSLIELHRATRWNEKITYLDSKKNEFTKVLFDLLLHVANHGVHHRAQSLHYLKHFDRTVPGGLDYASYRLAASTLPQDGENVKHLIESGSEVAIAQTPDPVYDARLIERMFRYHDWATGEVFTMCDSVGVASLDRDFGIGPGSIRKVLLHLTDVEQWWVNNWGEGNTEFPHSPEDMPLQSIRAAWSSLSKSRNKVVSRIDTEESKRVVTVHPGGLATRFHLGETTLHVALHGTHHRAQIVNMVKRSGGKVRDIDFPYAIT